MENLLNVKQVSELLSVKTVTLYKWTNKRLLPYYQLEECMRFKQKDVEKFVEERRVEKIKKLS